MIRTESRDVSGGIRVTVNQFPPLEALRWVTLLGTSLGGVLLGFVDMTKGKAKEAPTIDAKALQAALSPELLQSFTEALGKYTTAEYQNEGNQNALLELHTNAKIDIVFAGNLMGMLEWLWFGLELNFKDFLDFAQDMLPGESAKPSGSKSPAG